MRNTDRIVPMSGFVAAVERSDAKSAGSGAVAVGFDEAGAQSAFALTLRHADGTTLTAWLSPEGMGRLADLTQDLIGPFPAATLQ